MTAPWLDVLADWIYPIWVGIWLLRVVNAMLGMPPGMEKWMVIMGRLWMAIICLVLAIYTGRYVLVPAETGRFFVRLAWGMAIPFFLWGTLREARETLPLRPHSLLAMWRETAYRPRRRRDGATQALHAHHHRQQ